MRYIARTVAGKMLRFGNESPRLQFFDNFEAVGGQIWPCGDVLVNFLSKPYGYDIIQGANVIELGSGCGYVGIACGALGAEHVTMTDRLLAMTNLRYDMEGCLVESHEVQKPSSVLLDILRENVHLNIMTTKDCSFAIRELQWGKRHTHQLDSVLDGTGEGLRLKTFDVVIGSDLTYHADISVELFYTVREILSRHSHSLNKPPARFITSHQHRRGISTKISLDAAHAVGLKRNELWEGEHDGNSFCIWEFTL